MELGATVGSGGIDRGILIARSVATIATKHIIGRNMNEGDTIISRRLSEIAYSSGIDGLGYILLPLGALDIGEGRTIDYILEIINLDTEAHSFRVGNVNVVDISEYVFVNGLGSRLFQTASKLTVTSGNEDSHKEGGL